MEPLVAIIPQALPILIDRLSFYLSFLSDHGFCIRHQTACSLTSEQAERLLALTGDELFAAGTPVAVLLLEREAAYASFSALRAELDIVYGSGDRDAAMLDILSFFSSDTSHRPQHDALPVEPEPPLQAQQSEHDDLQPQAPTSRPPPPPAEPETLSIAVSPLQRHEPQQQQPEQCELTAVLPPAAAPSPATSAVSEGSPAPNTAFHWEEIEVDPARAASPSSPSPLPSSPSLTPVEFHPAPSSPTLSSATSSPLLLPNYHQTDGRSLPVPSIRRAELLSPLPPQAPPNTAALSSAAELKRAQTTPALLPQRQQPAAEELTGEAETLSPVHTVEIKRASLTAERSVSATEALAAGAASSAAVKGPQDLLALPTRRTIKERLAALNLKEEPAAAQQQQPAAQAVMRVETAGDGAAAMREKQHNISEMFSRRLSREKTKHAALLARFPSIAALGPDASVPSRPAGCDEYRSGLPSMKRLLASEGVSASGVLYHMTGEEAAWEQCFTVLHHDSLYLCAAGGEDAEVAVMLQLSEPGISLAYAEGVVEVKGERDVSSRHLLAADIPDIDRWYELMCSAKIQYATEERTDGLEAALDSQHAEEEAGEEAADDSTRSVRGRPARRGRLQHNAQAKALAAAFLGRPPSPLPAVVEEMRSIRQMKEGKGVVGVSAVRQAAQDSEEEKQQQQPAAFMHGVLTAPAGLHSPTALSSFSFPLPASLTAAPSSSLVPPQPDDAAVLRSLLVAGASFRKYRRRRAKARWLWCSPQLDRLYWGEVKSRKVKGQMLGADMLSVAEGCVGVKRSDCGLTVIGKERTLELEAETVEDRTRWIRAIALLINLNRS